MHHYLLRIQSEHSKQLAPTTSFKKVAERIRIISIINGDNRVILKFEELKCVSSDRRERSHYLQ
jgi:hypothetical protein